MIDPRELLMAGGALAFAAPVTASPPEVMVACEHYEFYTL